MIIQYKNSAGNWKDSSFIEWADVVEAGWQLVYLTDDGSAMMKKHGYYQEWRNVKNER